MQSGVIQWCNRLMRAGFYLLFGFIPLLLTPWNYELFEYNKMMGVYAVTVLITTAWIVKMVKERELRIARTPLDLPILLFVASQLVSTLFSIDPHVSWFGYYSRFNGGMWSILSYALLYYAFLSNRDIYTDNASRTPTLRLIHASLITGTVVAVYGVLERLGIDKHLWVQDVQNRVFSTLGQPNWLAAYLVALFPLTLAFAFGAQLTKHKDQMNGAVQHHTRSNFGGIVPMDFVVWSLLSILFFITLLFTRSRSGMFGFAIADIVFWALMILPKRSVTRTTEHTRAHMLKRPGIILHVIFAAIIFLNGTGIPQVDGIVTFAGIRNRINTALHRTSPAQQAEATASAKPSAGPALETGGTESGTIRKYVWQGAVNAWNSSVKTRLIGTGTETFAFAFYRFRPAGHNLTSEWDFLYNKAHNEYLNYLATTGAFGLGSYLLFIGAFIYWFVKTRMATHSGAQSDTLSESVTAALFSGWMSILVTNFFGFSVVILQLFLFLFPAVIFVLTPDTIRWTTKDLRPPQKLPLVIWGIGIIILGRIGLFWYADTLYARGYRMLRAGLLGQAIPALTGAIRINPTEPIYHDELGSAYATLAVSAFQEKNATQTAQLAVLAIDESGKAIATSPQNVNFLKTRTKVYYTLSALDASFNTKAVDSLKQAIPLSPNDPKIYYNLAILSGRDGDTEHAISALQKAKELKPTYRDAYYALWVFYTEEKRPADARAVIQEYLTNVDPNDADFQSRIK